MTLLDFILGRSTDETAQKKRQKVREQGMRKARYSEVWSTQDPVKKATDPHRIDREAPEKNAFVVAYDGPTIRSIRQLRDALNRLTDEQIIFHTQEHGNDFATWIRDIFGENQCADALEKCEHIDEMSQVLDRFCKNCV